MCVCVSACQRRGLVVFLSCPPLYDYFSFVCGVSDVSLSMCGGKRTTFRTRFSSSTSWVQGMEFRLSFGLAGQEHLPDKPSCWPC